MFLSKTVTTGVMSLALLTTLTGCGSDSGEDEGGSFFDVGNSPSSSNAGEASRPSAKTLRDVQEFITGAGLPCDNLTDDGGAHGTPLGGSSALRNNPSTKKARPTRGQSARPVSVGTLGPTRAAGSSTCPRT